MEINKIDESLRDSITRQQVINSLYKFSMWNKLLQGKFTGSLSLRGKAIISRLTNMIFINFTSARRKSCFYNQLFIKIQLYQPIRRFIRTEIWKNDVVLNMLHNEQVLLQIMYLFRNPKPLITLWRQILYTILDKRSRNLMLLDPSTHLSRGCKSLLVKIHSTHHPQPREKKIIPPSPISLVPRTAAKITPSHAI